jgi:hypothetical protein
MTNVSEASEAQRTAAQQQLEGFGINPGSTRFAGLDIGSRTTQAAAEAGAGTSAVQATKLQGLGLEAGVVNTGRGLPNTVAGLASTGVGAGAAGTGASQSNIATGSSAMTAPSNWFNTGASNMNTYVNAVNGYNQSQLGYAQVGAMQTAGFGALAGGLAGAFLQQGGPAISLSADMPQITQPTYSNPPTGSPAGMIGYPSGQHEERQVNAPVMIDRSASRQPYSGKGVYGRAEGRGVPLYRQAGGAIPPQGNPGNVTASPGATVQSALPPNGTPGGAIPPEASPSQGQQTDDVPARLTVGEFVNPRDVVEWKGQEFFYKQIDKIRQEAAAAKARTDIGGEQGYAPPARPTFVSRPQVVASNPAIPHARGVQYGGPITPGVNSGWSGAGPSTTYGAQSGAIPTQRLLQRRAVG